MQDSNGNLWFSTSGSGLDRYRKESNDFENFDMQKDGLSSDCIYEVFESSIQKGDLLLITNQGFSQFDYPQKKFYNYGTENGFPLTAVNENALFVTHDGEVFLGGIQGMSFFLGKETALYAQVLQHHPFPPAGQRKGDHCRRRHRHLGTVHRLYTGNQPESRPIHVQHRIRHFQLHPCQQK